MTDVGRDTFSLRFKDPRNREALRRMSELTGRPMTVIAEQAIEHEIILLAADLERRLEDALSAVRAYRPAVDLDEYIDAAVAGEEVDLAGGVHAQAAHAGPPHGPGTSIPSSDEARSVLAAFAR